MQPPTQLLFSPGLTQISLDDCSLLIVGQLTNLKKISFQDLACKFESKVDETHFKNAVQSLSPNPTDSVQLWTKQIVLSCLPCKGSRHNAPMSPHCLESLIKQGLARAQRENIVIVCERSDSFALAAAIARMHPLYNRKTSRKNNAKTLIIEFLFVGEDNNSLTQSELKCLSTSAEAIRLAARIVDTPTNEMNTSAFLEEVKSVGDQLGIKPVIIQGEDLKDKGFGGIYGVGKAAAHPPALAVLSHLPGGAKKNIAWVGKGIVYDTGGLSIKDKVHMPGMKRDCGGAAGILGAFKAAVTAGFTENLHCVLCLAENAVGPLATRPDDIHTMYSGLTVEINNTDAEGRLVLADGVSYAARDLKADIVVDMATLTGAQGISTGHYHAAILTNNQKYEEAAVQAGRWSGDLVHPLPFCPEMHFAEFNSVVADMKNSVKDRGNAQSSCAGLFIYAHLGFEFPGVWLHIDMAGPAQKGERATGYGVALLMILFSKYTKCSLLQSIAPSVNCV